MIVETIYLGRDTNTVKIPTAELLFQGAKHLRTKPKWVLQQSITNKQTGEFIIAATKALGGKDGTGRSSKQYFRATIYAIRALHPQLYYHRLQYPTGAAVVVDLA